nr:hypothetical protein [Tanacetum cinerariifolium]
QAQREAGALAEGGMNLHLAFVVIGDDEIRDRQAEPGALTDLLGREERLEGAFAHGLGHPDTVVLYLNLSPWRIQAGAQNDASWLFFVFALVNGLRGILEQVEQHLLQFIGGARHRTEFGVKLANDVLTLEVEPDGQVEVVAGDFHGL